MIEVPKDERKDKQDRMIELLEKLSAKVEALIQVVAVTSRKETVLKGKTKTDQIKTLSDLGLPRKIVALIVGTTPETISVRLSEMKRKGKKTKKNEEIKENDK